MKAWAVQNNQGQLITSTLRATRVGAIKAMVGDEAGYQNRWRWWKRRHAAKAVDVLVFPDETRHVCRECMVITRLADADTFGADS